MVEVNPMRFYGSYSDEDVRFHCLIDRQPDPAAFRMHTHDFCELFCFLSGQGVFRIEGSEYALEPGDILVMRSTEAHCIEPDPSQPYERMAVHFRRTLLEGIDPDGLLLSSFYSRDAGRFNRFRDVDFPDQNHRFYINAMLQPCENRRLQVLANLPPLLNCLYQAAMRRGEGLPAQEDTLMYRIIRHINRNLAAPLSLDSLCEEFFISKPQLCRTFKRATGATVGEYITVKRLLSARTMLRAGTPPTQVCPACGFNDYSAFYRAYRKQFGRSPQEEVPERPLRGTLSP